MALEHKALNERIIVAAIEVHQRLGPGLLAKTELEPKSVLFLEAVVFTSPASARSVSCASTPHGKSEPGRGGC
jgi:hypothetical protein